MLFTTRSICAGYEKFFAEINADLIRSQQLFCPEMEPDLMKITGGWATCDGIDAYNTQVIGWGANGEVSDDEIDQVLKFYENKPGRVRIEISCFADRTLIMRLENRGFRVRGWIVTAGKDIIEEDKNFEFKSPFKCFLATEKDEEVWVDTMNRGFLDNEDGELDPGLLPMGKAVFRSESIIPFIAYEGDKAVASSSLTVKDNIACLVAATTLPSFRRKGAQRDMQKIRIAHAAKMGAKTLLFEGLPGTESLHNAYKRGITALYSSVVLAREEIDNLVF